MSVVRVKGGAARIVRKKGGAVLSPRMFGEVASGVTAPTGPFTLGTQVGVPTGVTLTLTSGLPAPDATEQLTLTHPITGATANRTVSVWRRRRWVEVPFVNPASGATYLFDECEWDVPSTSWCVEIPDTNGTADQMAPLAVFRRCQFSGQDTSDIALAGSHIWVIGCHATGASDSWQGAAYSVAYDSNFIAGTNVNLPDPHSDGIQNAGTGRTTLHHCWCSAGPSDGANSAVRFGSEWGAVTNSQVHYCGLDDGGYALALRGDAGGQTYGVDSVSVVGCRWTETAVYGPVDAEVVTNLTWTDNKFFNGTTILSPV